MLTCPDCRRGLSRMDVREGPVVRRPGRPGLWQTIEAYCPRCRQAIVAQRRFLHVQQTAHTYRDPETVRRIREDLGLTPLHGPGGEHGEEKGAPGG